MTLKNTKSEPAQTAGNAPELKIPKYLQSSAKGMLRWRVATLLEKFNSSDIGLCKQIEKLAWAFSERTGFQERVLPWLLTCFGEVISNDKMERNHRFLEEALELVQSCGCSSTEAHQLVDYVFGRNAGDMHQEMGGVMVTLAALGLAQHINMHTCGETELARVWKKIDVIREKQANKPSHSPLPAEPAPSPATTPYVNLEPIGTITCRPTDPPVAGKLVASSQGPAREETIKALQHDYEQGAFGPFTSWNATCKALSKAFDAGAKSVVAAPQLENRSDKDYAIEHGGYLANAAEHYLNIVNESYRETDEADPDAISDCFSGLRNAIFEFRKRAAKALEGAAAPKMKISQWIDTELWNFAHALALDLGLSHDAAGEKSKEELIHRSMSAVIGICLRMAGAAALPSAQIEWISVEERLPEREGHYLVHIRKRVDLVWHNPTSPSDIWFWKSEITYWRELPSPPVPSKEPK